MCVPAGLSAVSAEFLRRTYFVSTQRNMTEAQRYCREKHTDLATIHNMQNVKVLNNTAANVSSMMSVFNLKTTFDNHVHVF